MNVERCSRGGLWLLAFIFAAVGGVGWFAPDLLFGPLQVDLVTPDARAEIRAAYGGHFFAWAVAFAAGARCSRLRGVALAGACLVLGGFVFGRLVSALLDGLPGVLGWANLVVESLGAGIAGTLWMLRRRQSPDSVASAGCSEAPS